MKDKYFGGMIKAGAVPFCYDGTPASAHSILEHIFTKQPTELSIQREMVVEKKELADTEIAESHPRNAFQETTRGPYSSTVRFLEV